VLISSDITETILDIVISMRRKSRYCLFRYQNSAADTNADIDISNDAKNTCTSKKGLRVKKEKKNSLKMADDLLFVHIWHHKVRSDVKFVEQLITEIDDWFIIGCSLSFLDLKSSLNSYS